MKIVILISTLLLTTLSTHAAEKRAVDTVPTVTEIGRATYQDWRWRSYRETTALDWIDIEQQHNGKWIVRNHIEVDCTPCDNPTEGDNCRQDGIRWIALEKRSTPLLLLVCHIGVNSQRAQLYEPNRAEPIREAVGAYFLNWSLDDDGIQIRYDSPSQDNEFSTNKESWP